MRDRPALSLVELIIFLALLAIASGSVMSILFSTNEQRIEQQTAASVERTGLQILQTLTSHIEQAERILLPALGSSGSILVLQTSMEQQNPTVIGLANAKMDLIERDVRQTITSDATVSHFSVTNTSPSDNHPSVRLSFIVTQPIPLSHPTRYYERSFETAVVLFPDDLPSGDVCGCPSPTCSDDIFHWQICDTGVCTQSAVTLPCSQ